MPKLFDLKIAFDQFSDSTLTNPSLTFSEKQRQQIVSETKTGLLKLLLPSLGHRIVKGRKATRKEQQRAFALLETIDLGDFPEIERTFQRQSATVAISKASRNTYGPRVANFFNWLKANNHWPQYSQLPSVADQCAPKLNHGHGKARDSYLTERRGSMIAYRLKPEEMTEAIKEKQQKIYTFLCRPQQPGRCFEAIEPESADQYLTDFNFFAGYLHHYHSVPLDKLTPEFVFPTVSPEELEAMGEAERSRCWKKLCRELEERLCSYHEFLRWEQKSDSPKTWLSKLCSLHGVARVLYADHVEVRGEYEHLPIFKTLARYQGEALTAVNQWCNQGKSVADLSKKIPNYPEGSTALDVVRGHVLELLRQECAPRRAAGPLRSGNAIARSLQVFLQLALISLYPARRQQEHRSLLVANTCPVTKPENVPSDGVIYPLPPNSVRKRNQRREIADNWLYKTYEYDGITYPDGVWVIEVTAYKTRKTWGVFSVELENWPLAGNTTFYHYLESHLCGVWLPRRKSKTRYHWWDDSLKGQRGTWVSTGRMEFKPKVQTLGTDEEGAEWTASNLFVKPRTGKAFIRRSDYARAISCRTYRLIGKHITPHIMRHIWATWAFQSGLSDEEIRALALMMAHSVDTLKRMYQKATPADQQKLLNKAIRKKLRSSLSGGTETGSEEVFQQIIQLKASERQRLFLQFKGLMEEQEPS